jgi:hypothetical protein
MFIRLVGRFEVRNEMGQDCTPRGAKARALLAVLCRTPDHRRPRRWLERKLWSDRGQEQASGSLRQALTELRKTLGPLASYLVSDRDCVGLEGVATDIDATPEAARVALRDGREFLEGIDIVDPAFLEWLSEERERVSFQLNRPALIAIPKPDAGRTMPADQDPASAEAGRKATLARDLAAAIARLTAEYLFLDRAEAERDGTLPVLPADGLDLRVKGDWSEDRAHLNLRLVAQSNQKTLWSQRLLASGSPDDASGFRGTPTVVLRSNEALLF